MKGPVQTSEVSSRGRWKGVLRWGLVLSSFLVIATFSLHRVVDTDIWWHLKTGEYTLKEGRLVTQDIFSYTAGDQSGVGIELWLLPQWLSQVILFGLYSLAGIPGLVLFKTAVLLASFALLYLIGYRKGNSTVLIGCLLFAAFTSHNWFSLRPYMFSLLFLALDFYILERYRTGERNLISLLPVIQIVWANMHQGHVVGMVLILCYLMGELVSGSKIRPFRNLEGMDRGRYWRLLVFGGLALVAGLVSFRTPQVLLRLTGLLRAEGAERPFAMIAEWIPPFSPEMQYLELLFYKLLIGASAVGFLLNLRKVRVSLLLVWAAFLVLSVTAHRNIFFFAPLTAPIIALNLSSFIRDSRLGRLRRPVVIEPALQGLLILFFLWWIPRLTSDSYYIQKGRPQRFGLGVSQISFPEKAVDFILEEEIPGNIFNDYDIGGYFLWRCYPDKKNFIDGRIVDPSFLTYYRRIVADPSLLDEVVERYRLNCALLSHTSPDAIGLIRKLYAERNWSLIYLDEVATVFVLNTPENQPLITQAQVDFLATRKERMRPPKEQPPGGWLRRATSKVVPRRVKYPFDNLGRGRILLNLGLYPQAELEVKQALRVNPDLAYPHYLLGRIYLWSGRKQEAISEYSKALEIDPGLAAAHDDLGTIYADIGDYEYALSEFRKAIRSGGGESAYSNLGALYLRMGRYDDAISAYRRALRVNPRHAGTHGSLGDIYFSRREHDKAIEEYRLALELDPKLLQAYLSVAAVYAQRGLYEEAVAECEKALEVEPRFAMAYYALGDVHSARLRSGREIPGPEKERLVAQAVRSYEQFIRYWTGDEGQVKAARRNIERLEKLAPD